MALIDHFAPDAGTEPGGNGFERLPAHTFATLLAVGNNGVFGNAAAARTRIISEFNLQTADEPQLDAIITAIVDAVGTEEKYKIIRDVEDALLGYESAHITKAEAISNVGL